MQKPDRLPEGTEYIICPILEDKAEGITRDKPETEDEEAQRTVKMAQRLMARDPNGAVQMRSLYPIMVSVEHSVLHYRKFLRYSCAMRRVRCCITAPWARIGSARQRL